MYEIIPASGREVGDGGRVREDKDWDKDEGRDETGSSRELCRLGNRQGASD